MAKVKGNNRVKYSVQDYLTILKAAKRSEATIKGYYKVFQSYAKFLGVPLDEVHHHLSVSNLLKYAGSRNGKSDNGNKTNLNVLRRYFTQNGIVFDELEYNATNPKVTKEQNDKPLELETLQKMMDLTDPHGRAVLSFLISTGCRAGETCKILLSDVQGDVVTIRNEIAKGRHGGKVYLTAEAREYLDLWLADRDEYIRISDKRMKGLLKAGAHHRPQKDERLFATAYTGLNAIFSRLYEKVDGEKGKYHNACTIHSCRKFFRTHAAKTMHPDLVTGLMRQTGYLDSTYVRMTDEEKRKAFHEGEAALYITRADHRVQSGKLSQLERDNAALKARLTELEQAKAVKDTIRADPAYEKLLARIEALESEKQRK